MHKLTKAEIMREVKDYIYITLGLISYSLGWAVFLLPYQITTGGTTGIGAIIYYATGFPIQWSYFIINAVLMTFAIRILGPKFSIKTTYAIFMLTFLLWLFQLVVNNYIKQQIEKSFAMYIYDYKFPDLSEIAYNHLLKHKEHYKVRPEFYVINFDDPRRSHRCNPINPKFMADISDAYESAYTIMLNLNKTWV